MNYLLYASSSSVYGNNKKVPFSEDDNVDHHVSLYAEHIRAMSLWPQPTAAYIEIR